MTSSRNEKPDKVSTYTKLRQKVEGNIYGKGCQIILGLLVLAALMAYLTPKIKYFTGFPMWSWVFEEYQLQESFSLYFFLWLFILWLFWLGNFFRYTSEDEDKTIRLILDYFQEKHLDGIYLHLLKLRALEGKSASLNKTQFFVVLIPSVFGLFGTSMALILSANVRLLPILPWILPVFSTIMLGLFSALVDEIRRARFDSALITAVQIFYQHKEGNIDID